MSTIRNWKSKSDTHYINEGDERYTVRLLRRAITPIDAEQQYSVWLLRNGFPQHHIATETRKSDAMNEMVGWINKYQKII